MAGIYIHIPFCRSRCIYCAFYSTTDLRWRQRYVDAVCREWQLRNHEMSTPATTVYFGGGTPSQLTPQQLQQLLTALPRQPPRLPSRQTPMTSPLRMLRYYRSSASTVSPWVPGPSTTNGCISSTAATPHGQVKEAVHHLRNAGIRNISIDLMYGFPGETLSDWERDIDVALSLDVEHISAYCLTIEKGTPFSTK